MTMTMIRQQQQAQPVGPPLIAGRNYRFTSDLPRGRKGHLYHLHGMVLDVSSRQQKVLVEALTGPDAGLLFVSSESNFAFRYVLEAEAVTEAETEEIAEAPQTPDAPKVIDMSERGSGV